jgi:hypothetical protein
MIQFFTTQNILLFITSYFYIYLLFIIYIFDAIFDIAENSTLPPRPASNICDREVDVNLKFTLV